MTGGTARMVSRKAVPASHSRLMWRRMARRTRPASYRLPHALGRGPTGTSESASTALRDGAVDVLYREVDFPEVVIASSAGLAQRGYFPCLHQLEEVLAVGGALGGTMPLGPAIDARKRLFKPGGGGREALPAGGGSGLRRDRRAHELRRAVSAPPLDRHRALRRDGTLD